MKRLSNRGFAAMTLLSIILPVSLLISFRMSGIIPEPQTPETIPVQPIYWNMSRTSDMIDIEEFVENYYVNGGVSIKLTIRPIGVYKDDPDSPAWGGDYVKLRVSAVLNISDGFIYSVLVKFSKTNTQSYLCIERHPESMLLQNLEVKIIYDEYFKAVSVNQPKNASLSILCWWAFFDEDSNNHWVTVTLETIYFNRTAYQKVIIPINLGVLVL